MKVLKFGGSSVKDADRIKLVIDILKNQKEKYTVVFSALGGVTDMLISMSESAAEGNSDYLKDFATFKERHIEVAKALLNKTIQKKVIKGLEGNFLELQNILEGIKLLLEATPRTMDYVLSFGERNSAYIIANALTQRGVEADYLDARKIIKTDKNFGSAAVKFKETNKSIKEHYDKNDNVQVVTGFIASHTGGLTTTLGRGGSDYTAAILGAALKTKCIEIWTDVDGILTADPRKVPEAFTIPIVTYEEAMEMSHFGAKVIYPPTIQPALKAKIPVYIKNTFNPSHDGSLISNKKDKNNKPVKGISSISNIALLSLQGTGMFGVPGTAGRLFSSLARESINIILITQGSSEHSISFAIQPKEVKKAVNVIEKEFEHEIRSGSVDKVKREEDLSVIAIIGEHMRETPGIAGRLFKSLGQNGINVIAIAQGSSELNISVVIKMNDEKKALNALHESFFLSETKSLHIFMVGVGLIGSTLLDQINKQRQILIDDRALDIKVVGIANSRTFLINENGIDLDKWKSDLKKGEQFSMDDFSKAMVNLNLRNSVFIDNTASSIIADKYEFILNNSISISTPNKIAASSSFKYYEKLKELAKRRGVSFKYETNVGAGLPVLNTLKDLINSGDKINKIEGVLSGSLSYIFNSFTAKDKFSAIVKKAQELGYTEPDPREDLNGGDIKRKITILARESGASLEMKDVKVDYLLPKSCRDAKTVEDFYSELEKKNDYFRDLITKSEEADQKLRMIARYEKGKTTIKLESVDSDHPFYGLKGTDNMIIFTTERYKELPLVVRGPGAGADVTAAGIFAEIIGISNSFS
ncbi:bifunctional aspartate kinase/homoserine dehydrogenase I [Portibacter lacus]|uniref:Bifunctional aspartate kinase/homoserine dehydrogenase I n=1 Tax=Portibacter lacus TaxID=1099794 RepID=A0AA37WFL8_9BACT|nr:bifunctional aspartate kinase/homoserine dehydrogenase I [Portibacter lacus]GLR18913.1 bifunctional aspartate kinase/homoserine dehydrogenase I [Portibacter lacus]